MSRFSRPAPFSRGVPRHRRAPGMALALALCGPLGPSGPIPAARADEAPPLYRQIADRYGLSAETLYRLAVEIAGRQSRFAAAPTPWPWTVRLCARERCETVYPAGREAMARVLDAGREAGLALYVGPLGLPLASVPDLPARAATSPRVTLDQAARQLALALAARAEKPPGPAAAGPGSAAPLATPLARRWGPLVERIAREEGLDPALAHAVVAAESAYDPRAVSPKRAAGLMQLMPATAERFGLPRERRLEPEANLRAGIRYLKWLLACFDRDPTLAIAGYNAGENAVLKYGRRVPPYPETRTYVRRVAQFLARVPAVSPTAPGDRR